MIPSQCRYGNSPSLKSYEQISMNIEIEENLNLTIGDFLVGVEPRFIRATDGHLFDINTNSTEVVAKVILEELETREQAKRVTNSAPVKTIKNVPQIEFSEYNVHARAEWEATYRSFELARRGFDMIFWISAEDGAMGLSEDEAKKKGLVYPDGRFNIYFRTVEDEEIVLKGKHIPLDIDRFQSFELGQRLLGYGGETLGKIETVDNLRVQPIGFSLENSIDWISECRRMMPEFEIFWGVIERGEDMKLEEEVAKIVEEAKIIANGNNALFQLEMIRRGYRINAHGNHGSGYLDLKNSGIYDFRIEMNGDNFMAEKKKVNGKFVCPICGLEVAEGANSCSTCGISFKK